MSKRTQRIKSAFAEGRQAARMAVKEMGMQNDTDLSAASVLKKNPFRNGARSIWNAGWAHEIGKLEDPA